MIEELGGFQIDTTIQVTLILLATLTLINAMREVLFSAVEKPAEWIGEQFLNEGWRRKVRVWLRVKWLFLKRAWRENVSFRTLWRMIRRPMVLLVIGLGLPILLWWALGISALFQENDFSLQDQVDWRAIAQPLVILIGLPSAFILWAFRDFNAQANLENQRKDINLKEFQEIQLRAAGAMDKDLPAKARETLQIAAIHQLRPFLRGEYGESFRRPAWELLRARLESSAEETGLKAITDWTENQALLPDKSLKGRERGDAIRAEIEKGLRESKPSPVTQAERVLIKEEAARLFRKPLPLNDSRFGQLQLQGALLSGLELGGSSFVGGYLWRAHLEEAVLFFAHMEGADLANAHLEGADLRFAHLEGAEISRALLFDADLRSAHLEGALLVESHLDNANLTNAYLEGANLRGASLKGAILTRARLMGAELADANLMSADLADANLLGANLERARFSSATIFTDDWLSIDQTKKDEIRASFVERGMINVDAPKTAQTGKASTPEPPDAAAS